MTKIKVKEPEDFPQTIGSLFRQVGKKWPPFWRKYRILLIAVVLLILVGGVMAYIFLRDRDRPYINSEIGYEFTVPRGWNLTETNQKKTVVIEKIFGRKGAKKTTIRIDTALGNPYGQSPLEYIQKGMIPQAQYAYESLQHKSFTINHEPYTRFVNEREWGVVRIIVDYDEILVIYVTSAGEYTLGFILDAPKGDDQNDAEKTFFRLINNVKFNPLPPRKNVFLEGDTGNLFSTTP